MRIIGSIHTGAVRAYDVVRMLSRDGRPTPLGDAIAHYGRIAKTLRLTDEPGYRPPDQGAGQRSGRPPALARKIFTAGLGSSTGATRTAWRTRPARSASSSMPWSSSPRYMDAAVTQLRADGFDVRDEDVARLSPFVRHHVNMLGRYSFRLPDLPGGLRPLRDKNAAADE